jgi:predicted  nucleic acid-binding Zn-ribbon protein
LHDARESFSVSSEEITTLKKDSDALLAELAHAKAELWASGEKVNTLQAEKKELQKEVQQVSSNLKYSAILKADISKQKSNMEKHLNTRKTNESEMIKELQGQLDSRLDQAASEELKAQVAEYQAKNSDLTTELEGVNAKLKAAQNKVIETSITLDNASASLLETSSLEGKLVAQISELQSEVARLQGSSELSEVEVDQLKDQVETLKNARGEDLQKLERLAVVQAEVEELNDTVKQTSADLAAKTGELARVSSEKGDLAAKLITAETDLMALKIETDAKIEALEKDLKEAKAVKVVDLPEPPMRPAPVDKSAPNEAPTQISAVQGSLPSPPPSPSSTARQPETDTSVGSAVATPPVIPKPDASPQSVNKPKRFNVCLGICLFMVTVFAAVGFYKFPLGSSTGLQGSLGLIPPNGSTWDPLRALIGNTNPSNDTYSADSNTAYPRYQLPSDTANTVIIEMPTSGFLSHIPSELLPTCDPSARPGCFALVNPYRAPGSDDEDSTKQSILRQWAHAASRIPVCSYRALFTDTNVKFMDCLHSSS